MVKNKFRHGDFTWILLMFILVDMDRLNQDICIGTKYSIIGPLP